MSIPISIILILILLFFLKNKVVPKVKLFFTQRGQKTKKIRKNIFGEESSEGTTIEESQNLIDKNVEKEGDFGEKILTTILFVLFVSFFELAKSIFSVFYCITPDLSGESVENIPIYNYKMPWVICSLENSIYKDLLIAASIFAFFYVFGILLLFSLLIYLNRGEIKQKKVIPWLAFYYKNYKPEFYWFELLWMTRRMLIVLCFYLISNSIHTQRVVVAVVLFFFCSFQSDHQTFSYKTREYSRTFLFSHDCNDFFFSQ